VIRAWFPKETRSPDAEVVMGVMCLQSNYSRIVPDMCSPVNDNVDALRYGQQRDLLAGNLVADADWRKDDTPIRLRSRMRPASQVR
jgi:hypothetical protein